MAGEIPRYCEDCGAALLERDMGTPPARRLVCRRCGRIRYRNPTVGVAVVIMEENRLLLGRRARGPYAEMWCIPCGYVEWGEDVRDAARREMREETGLEVEIGDVVAVHSNFHDPARLTVGIWFRGRVLGGVAKAGDDLDQLQYFSVAEPPPLAFPTDRLIIEQLRALCVP